MRDEPGAGLLVSHGLATKRGAGLYEPTVEGRLVRRHFSAAAAAALTAWGQGACLEIDRAARRPEPRQLVRFTILHWAFDVPPVASVLDLVLPAYGFLASLGLDMDLRQPAVGRMTLETEAREALRHALVTAVLNDKTCELSIGVDAVLVALLAQDVPWPPVLGPVLPCFCSSGSAQRLDDLRDLARAQDIRVHARPLSVLSKVEAPCVLVSRGGWTVLAPDRRCKATTATEALDAWRAAF